MFDRIVWATDGSPAADAALTLAKRLAADGGRIVAVHCTQLLTGRAGGYPADPEDPEVLERIRSQVAELEQAGYDVSLETHRATAVADTVAAVADHQEADLIVCGTRGLTALAGAVGGSVSHRLLHAAHAPVLVVPESVREPSAVG